LTKDLVLHARGDAPCGVEGDVFPVAVGSLSSSPLLSSSALWEVLGILGALYSKASKGDVD